MKLFLCPNVYDAAQQKQAKDCIAALEKQGYLCALSSDNADLLFGETKRTAFSAGDCDFVVSLGGDGAVLRAAQTAVSSDRPLIGINSGRLGFLCVATIDQIDRFSEILADCKPSVRHLLAFSYLGETHLAVNDVVIAKTNFGAAVDLTVSVDGFRDYTVRGDGFIISTPTGSTAYNYSAGGPILDVSCDAIALTPLCAHHGNTRTVITKSDNTVSVSARNNDAMIFADGCKIGTIQSGFRVERASRTLLLYMRENSYHTNVMQ